MNSLTRRKALGIPSAASLQPTAYSATLEFPKGAVIRTVPKDASPELPAGLLL